MLLSPKKVLLLLFPLVWRRRTDGWFACSRCRTHRGRNGTRQLGDFIELTGLAAVRDYCQAQKIRSCSFFDSSSRVWLCSLFQDLLLKL